jgi:hypothetical protein
MTTRQRKLNSNLEVRRADEQILTTQQIEELRREKLQNDKVERERRQLEKFAILAEQSRREEQRERGREKLQNDKAEREEWERREWEKIARIAEQSRREREREEREERRERRREKERIARIDEQHRLEQERLRSDPTNHYSAYLGSDLLEPRRYEGQTSEERLEQVIRILWSRMEELEQQVKILREQK